MMKKILTMIISLFCIFLFGVACSVEEEKEIHQHEWELLFSDGDTFHWLECGTCKKIEKEVHKFDKNGWNECSVCKEQLGLVYAVSEDGTYARVIDHREMPLPATKKVRIADTYKGLPVKVINKSAFNESFGLTMLVIPATVETIEDETFRWCEKLLEVINYSPSITIEKGAKTNGYVGFSAISVFNAGEEYKSEFINDNGCAVYTDGDEKIVVDYVGTETSVTIPSYITQIYPRAFQATSIRSIVIPDSVKLIGDYAFKGSRDLTDVIIPDSVETIEKGAFRGCSSLRTAQLGSAVKVIGDFAFDDCTSLTTVNIPDGVTVINEQTFMSCASLPFIKIPDSVTEIKSGAFWGCKNLASIELGSGVVNIEEPVFSWCKNLQKIIVSDDNISYKSIDGNLYSKDGKNLFRYAIGKNATDFVIPESVQRIGEGAFSSCTLTNVVFHSNITTIDAFAFEESKNLTSIAIPDSVTSVGYKAFFKCSRLTNVVIGKNVSRIGFEAFRECGSLTSIIIPSSVSLIGAAAFYRCWNLTIYCEAVEKPNGWDEEWNDSDCPVEWGYTGSE